MKLRMPGFVSIMLLLLLSCRTAVGDDFADWHNSDKWDVAGDAALDPDNSKLLIGKPGIGVLVNGKLGKCPSLVTKRDDYRDVEVHVEFMVAKGSNSGVIFHGNYEIQILDSYGVKQPKAGDCGGVYPRAEGQPGTSSYHHIDGGSPPRVNAAKPPGEWQTLDIIFQAARFDDAGKKTANARFIKVVHNGQVIQENVEVPYASGTNWDRKQFPQGPVILQGDYGPVAFRNVRVRPWKPAAEALNVPPEGFTALFNGKDFTGWRMSPKATAMWTVEDGALKSHGLLDEWGADLMTEKEYQDFVLLADFRMPATSDSGIFFRKLIPDMGDSGQSEQFKIRPENGMGQLMSFYFMPESVKNSLGLEMKDLPRVKRMDPEIGAWHTVKLTAIGRSLTAELDGEVIIDNFQYPKGLLAIEPAPIRFQKHRFLEGANPGERNPCPIEYRNIFIKEIGPSKPNVPPEGFTALFNGKDLTGWRVSPKVKEFWSVEDGVLKSHGLLKEWGACLATEKQYRDFVLMLEFRMPTISDSGINFRRLIPEIPGFGDQEQFNLRSKGGMGHLESYYFLPKDTAKKMGLKEEEKPHLRYIDPEVGVWHTVKLTMKGRTFSAEYDGEVLYDNFQFHDWMMNMEPAPIRLQKHIVVHGDNLGAENPCPIEYRNIFIKEFAPGAAEPPAKRRVEAAEGGRPPDSPNVGLLSKIDRNDLPQGYTPAKHQEYVDRRMAELSEAQRAKVGQLWQEKQRIQPDMPNRGASFVKILEYVAANGK